MICLCVGFIKYSVAPVKYHTRTENNLRAATSRVQSFQKKLKWSVPYQILPILFSWKFGMEPTSKKKLVPIFLFKKFILQI